MKRKMLLGLVATMVISSMMVGCNVGHDAPPEDLCGTVVDEEVEDTEIEDIEDEEKNDKPSTLTELPENSTKPIEEVNGVVKGYSSYGFVIVGNEDIGYTVLPNNDYGTTRKVSEGVIGLQEYEVTDREGNAFSVILEGFDKGTYDFEEVADLYCSKYEEEDSFITEKLEEGEAPISCDYYMEYVKDGLLYTTYFNNYKDSIQIVTVVSNNASLLYSESVFGLYETVSTAIDGLEEKFGGEVYLDGEEMPSTDEEVEADTETDGNEVENDKNDR